MDVSYQQRTVAFRWTWGISAGQCDTPTSPEWLQGSSSSTLLNLDISTGHRNLQTRKLLNNLGCLATCCLEEISTPSHSYWFMDNPAGVMVSITFSTISDINRIHDT
ncbi:hypothetical protein TNCV_4959381 [Trichonephila clavipes]|uniref:Uncharacterized protein n=1 Tax=Trichonephila clavipes TaxID=2585209 RepID=A0A8X6VMG1_TRICX|nr:hypothetical protein TNCV_4959381 [Trichonephila clavipes]